MADIVTIELQTISGGLHLAKRALDDVFAKVTANPGPTQDPQKMQLLADIISTSQLINQEATQIQAIFNALPPVPGVAPAASSIEVKKDVRYLDDAARARIAKEALGIKLATYHYKSETADERQHLGFILEDSPNVPAADMAQKHVDLYAYASMVLATVQEQQRKIEALEAEVARLSK
jgi:hypothetical protein